MLDENYNLTIEKGRIDNLQIGVPWSQIISVGSKIEVDGIHLVLKLGFNERNEQVNPTVDNDNKMVLTFPPFFTLLQLFVLTIFDE